MLLSHRKKTDLFDSQAQAAYAVEGGARFQVEVADCFGRWPLDPRSSWSGDANPITGPMELVGVEPGAVVGVVVIAVEVVGDGFYGSDDDRIEVEIDLRERRCQLPGGWEAELSPHVGTIGVAPRTGAMSTRLAGDHGGNLDCPLVDAGSQIFFSAGVPGGLLGFGDIHAAMGDGEVGGQGVEAAGIVSAMWQQVPGLGVRTPHILSDGRFAIVAAGATLDEAASRVVDEMIAALQPLTGQSAAAIRKHLGIVADLRVCSRVGRTPTMRLELPLDTLHTSAVEKLFRALGARK